MADTLTEWYENIPSITKFLFFGILIPSFATKLGGISLQYLFYTPKLVFKNFELWRILTSLFILPPDITGPMQFIMLMYYLYSYSILLETGIFNNRKADYVYLLLIFSFLSFIAASIVNIYFMPEVIIFSILYLWTQLNANEIVQFWFGITFKARYFSWVLFLIMFLFSANWLPRLVGILIGHFYYFVKYKYSVDFNGFDFIKTPSILYYFFPRKIISKNVEINSGYTKFAPVTQENTSNIRWGKGRKLCED